MIGWRYEGVVVLLLLLLDGDGMGWVVMDGMNGYFCGKGREEEVKVRLRRRGGAGEGSTEILSPAMTDSLPESQFPPPAHSHLLTLQ
jgi:hypothetical protein